jgi:hypothetical protein
MSFDSKEAGYSCSQLKEDWFRNPLLFLVRNNFL